MAFERIRVPAGLFRNMSLANDICVKGHIPIFPVKELFPSPSEQKHAAATFKKKLRAVSFILDASVDARLHIPFRVLSTKLTDVSFVSISNDRSQIEKLTKDKDDELKPEGIAVNDQIIIKIASF